MGTQSSLMLTLFFLVYYSPSEFPNHCSQGADGGSGSTASKPSGSTDHYTVKGTFCPISSDASIEFYAYSDKVNFWMDTDNGRKTASCDTTGFLNGKCCSASKTLSGFSAHKCYPYYVHQDDECGGGEKDKNKMYIKYVGVEDALYWYSYKCSDYNDCYGNYWGTYCSNYVPTIYAGECQVSLGTAGTGKCDCSSATKMQNYCQPTSNTKVKYYWREWLNDAWINKGSLDSIHLSDSDSYYSQYRIYGKIYLTQKCTYTFKLSTKTPASIDIGGSKGGASNFVHCSPDSSYDYEVQYTATSFGKVSFEIIIDTGCSLDDVDATLYWKYGSQTWYSSIPAKYLYES